MKFILSALAAVTLLVGVAAAQPAEARSFWNGVSGSWRRAPRAKRRST